jgi:hypothetical protein
MFEAIKSALEPRWSIRFTKRLGFGRDGEVYATDRITALSYS